MNIDESLVSLYTTIPIQSTVLFLHSGGALDSFQVTGTVKELDSWTESHSTSEFIYNSTFQTPNLAIKLTLSPASGMKFSIVARRKDANNYIAASFDYENDQVQLIEVLDGVINVLSTAVYAFRFREKLSAELWVFGEQLYVWCNNTIILYDVSSYFVEETGFSIRVDSLPNGFCIFGSIGIMSLVEQPAQQLEGDPSFLPLTLRKVVQSYPYPVDKTWDNYKTAFKYHQLYKDEWYSNKLWRDLGYSALPPSTEEFFGQFASPRTAVNTYYPWIEVNSISDTNAINTAITAIPIWKQIANTFIISTSESSAHSLYSSYFTNNFPGTNFICGIKTTNSLPVHNFHDIPSWQRIGSAVAQMVAQTGVRICVLENETALEDFWGGGFEINYNDLAVGLSYLPQDVEYWWHPGPASNNNAQKERWREILTFVISQLNIRIIDPNISGPKRGRPDGDDYDDGIDARALTDEISELAPASIIYTWGDTEIDAYPYWACNQFGDAITYARDSRIIIYPGISRFVTCAQTIIDSIPA